MAGKGAAQAAATAITRRMDALGMSQQELAVRSGVSTSTIRKLQRGTQTSYQRPKLAALSRELGWAPDVVARLLAGEAPDEALQAASGGGRAGGRDDGLHERIDRLSEPDRHRVADLVDRLLGVVA
jgi:transcriptional regulator with XRE-family HTH domain